MSNYVSRGCIVWDMDDTLAHFMEPTLTELRYILKKDLNVEDLKNSMWLNDFLTKDELDKFLPYVFNSSFYGSLAPTAILAQKHSHEFKSLHTKFDFHVVTARRYALGRRALSITADWLAVHAHEVMDGISICHPDQPKIEVLPQNTVAVVDDSARVCMDVAKLGCKAFLIDRPWNQHVQEDQFPHLYRVTHETALAHMARVLA